jgi:hypothetical protein
LIVCLIASHAVAAESPSQSFSPEAWRRAADRHVSDWSRETMVHEFVTIVPESRLLGMKREAIAALLGEPGLSDEYFYPGSGPQGRFDIYRLSAKNNPSLRIDYGLDNTVSGVLLESSACVCEICGSDNAVTRKTFERTLLQPTGETPTTRPTIAQVETLLGSAGKSDVMRNVVGGQAWANYTDVWRVAGEANRYFIASGHIVARDWKSVAEAPADEFSIITMWPDCLPS